jgi:predicted phosphodiesterase
MIIVTGDTHGDFSRLTNERFTDGLTENDYIIVCGDFGLLWSKGDRYNFWLEQLSSQKFNILWVDGNHENFDWIDSLKVEQWHGGNVHKIADNIIHLMRGQLFEIENKTFFTFGGGKSVDITGGLLDVNDPKFYDKAYRARRFGLPFRVIGESWWEQEMPNDEEKETAIINLSKHDNYVDYIITHSLPTSLLSSVGHIMMLKMKGDDLTNYLDKLENTIKFKHWYCGHYHTDSRLDDKHTVMYKSMKEII